MLAFWVRLEPPASNTITYSSALYKVHAPARTYVNAQLRYAASNWLYVAHQTQSQTFDARCNNPTHRFIGQVIKPRSKFGKRFDRVHN